jgi:hypothetical protein
MLKALTSKEVSLWWDEIKPRVASTLGSAKNQDVIIEATLTSLLKGNMICWVVEENEEILGTLLTQVIPDTPPEFSCLLISGFSMGDQLGKYELSSGLDQLREYAKSRDCARILALVEDDRILSLARSLNFDIGTTLIDLEVYNG